MKFSLVLATIERRTEVGCFLQSLALQTYKDFEVIIVDQNRDDRLASIIDVYRKLFPIIYKKSERGLSCARNLGLNYISGDIVSFPDDDCEYLPTLLQNVVNIFMENPDLDGVTGKTVDKTGMVSVGRFSGNKGKLGLDKVWTQGVSITIFLKKSIVEQIGTFDVNLGVGANTPWQSGEETDYLIRGIRLNASFQYNPQITVIHSNPIPIYNENSFKRALEYGQGMGYVLRKHKYETYLCLYMLLRPLGGIIFSLVKGKIMKAKYHWYVLKGRYLGWFAKEANNGDRR